jgi:hypothetical protein
MEAIRMNKLDIIKAVLNDETKEWFEIDNDKGRKRLSDPTFESQDHFNVKETMYADYQPHRFRLDVEFTIGRKFTSTIALREWVKGNTRLRTNGQLEIRVAYDERETYEQHPSDRQEIDGRVA